MAISVILFTFSNVLPDLSDRPALPALLALLHGVPLDAILPETEEALHQVHRTLVLLHIFLR